MKLRSYSIAAIAASLIVGTAFAQGAPAASTQVKPAVEATQTATKTVDKTAETNSVVANDKKIVKSEGKADAKKVATHKHASGAMKATTAKTVDATKQDGKPTAKVGMTQTPAQASK
jgi:hypothetical protein